MNKVFFCVIVVIAKPVGVSFHDFQVHKLITVLQYYSIDTLQYFTVEIENCYTYTVLSRY